MLMSIAQPHTTILNHDPTTIEETVLNDHVDHPRVGYLTKRRLLSGVVVTNTLQNGIHLSSPNNTLRTRVCVEYIALIRRSNTCLTSRSSHTRLTRPHGLSAATTTSRIGYVVSNTNHTLREAQHYGPS